MNDFFQHVNAAVVSFVSAFVSVCILHCVLSKDWLCTSSYNGNRNAVENMFTPGPLALH